MPASKFNRLKALNENTKKQKQAEVRTRIRLEKHSPERWGLSSARDLAVSFPKLGFSIFNKPQHTTTNKTIFLNKSSGWYICYDKLGKYNTVHDDHGHYVALNGESSKSGCDEKYHFRNT